MSVGYVTGARRRGLGWVGRIGKGGVCACGKGGVGKVKRARERQRDVLGHH